MPIGVLMNVGAVVIGGILGAVCGHKLSEELKTTLNMIFGLCALGMGISSISLMENMPAVVFAMIIGTTFGVLIHLGRGIQKAAGKLQQGINKMIPAPSGLDQTEYMSSLITIIVLFCSSGTGIYGTIVSGFSGDHSILIAKSVLDIFTAMIFACNLGMVVAAIAVPQFIIFLSLFFMAKFIFPLTTPSMINDFKAAGGFLLVATGLRMLKLKEFPLADMIPAMVIVMPVSWAWTNVIMPLIG